MDELQKLYDLLVREGKYSKTFEEFQGRWGQDPSYQEKVYDVVSRDGFYSKDKDSFLQKYSGKGINAEQPAAATAVETDETAPAVAPAAPIAPSQPYKSVYPFEVSEEQKRKSILDPNNNYSDVPYGQKAPEFHLETIKKKEPIPKRITESIESIDTDLINGTEEHAVPKLNYQFGDLGFKFEESGATGDWVTVTAPNGETKEVGLNPLFGWGAQGKADELKGFITQHMPQDATQVVDGKKYKGSLAEMEAKYAAQRKKFNNEVEFKNATADFNQKANALQLEQQEWVKLSPATQEYMDKKASIEAKRIELAVEQSLLESKIGEYSLMKSSQGTWYGDIANWFLEGGSSMTAGGVNILMDAASNLKKPDLDVQYIEKFTQLARGMGMTVPENLTDEEFKDWTNSIAVGESRRDEINAKIKDDELKGILYGTGELGDDRKGVMNVMRTASRDVFGDKNTTIEHEELSQEGFWGGQIAGITKMIPSLLAGGWVAKTAGLFTQINDGISNEMQNNPNFENISENEKMSISLPIALVNAVLMEAGLSKVLSGQSGIVNGIIKNTMLRVGAKATAAEFKMAAENEVKSMVSKGLISMANSAASGFVLGTEIKVSEDIIKGTYNMVKGQEMFKTPDSGKDWAMEILKSGVSMAAGGLIMGIPGSIHAAVTETGYKGMADDQFKLFEMAAKDDNAQGVFVSNIKSKVDLGKMTLKEGKEYLNNYRNSVGLFKSLPEGLNLRDRKVAMDLLREKRDLERQKEGKDPALTKPIAKRIEVIDEFLTKLSDDAIQKREANESLLRAGQQRLGLPQVGTGNAQPEITTEAAKEAITAEEQRYKDILDDPKSDEHDIADAKAYLADPIAHTEATIKQLEADLAKDPTNVTDLEKKALEDAKNLLEAHNVSAEEIIPEGEATVVTVDEIENNRKLDLADAKDDKERKDINDYYDNLLKTVPAVGTKTVEQLRADEQAELDSKIENADQYRVDGKVDRTKLTNEEDIKAFDEIYNKYDKLITPLLEETKTAIQPTGAEPVQGTSFTVGGEGVTTTTGGVTGTTEAQVESTQTAGRAKQKPVMERDEVKKEVPAIIRGINKAMDAGKEFAEALKIATESVIKKVGDKYRNTIEKGITDIFSKSADTDIKTHPDYKKVMEDIDLEATTSKKSIEYVQDAYDKVKAVHEDYKDNDNYEKGSKRDILLKKRIADAKKEVEDYKTYSEQAKIKAIETLVNSEMYKDASDVQKETLTRDVLERFGERQKTAPTPEELFGNVSGVKALMEQIDFLFNDANKSKKYLEKEYNRAKKALAKNPTSDTLKANLEKAQKDIDDYKTKNIEEAVKHLTESGLYKNMTSDAYQKAVSDYVEFQKSSRYKDGSKEDKLLRKKIEKANADIDARKQKMVDYITDKFSNSLKTTISPVELFGNIKDISKVSMTEKSLLAKQIKDLARGAKDLSDLTKDLATGLRKLAAAGKIKAKQTGAILKKLATVDKSNVEEVKKFVDYVTKVFKNADYDENLTKAESARSAVAKLSAIESKNAHLTKLGKDFLEIKPSMVEDLAAYTEMANKIRESLTGSELTKDMSNPIKAADMVKISEAMKYINDTMDAQREALYNEKLEQVQEAMGIDASEFSYEELVDMLKKNTPINPKNETIIRKALGKMFDTYSTIINKIFTSGKDPFTGEKIDVKDSDRGLVTKFMGMDLELLQPKEILAAIDSLVNFIQNGSTAKMRTVVEQYQGEKNALTAVQEGLRAFELKQFGSKNIGRVFGEQIMSLPILFTKMFKGSSAGAKFSKLSGITELSNKKAYVQTLASMINNEFANKFYTRKNALGIQKSRQANGSDFNSEFNNIERNMYADAKRTVIGTPEEQQADFDKSKRLAEQSIEALKNGSEKEQQKAKAYQEVYDKIFKDSNNIEELTNKVDALNVEGVDWWIKKWSDIYDQLADVSVNVHNKVLDRDLFYSPRKFSMLFNKGEVEEIANDASLFNGNYNGTVYKEKSGVLHPSERPSDLPTNGKTKEPKMFVDYSFDRNNANAMYDALMDIYTSGTVRKIEAFFNSKNFKKIVPSSEDRALLYNDKKDPKEQGRIQTFIRTSRGKSMVSSDELSKLMKGWNRVASIGTAAALGAIIQPIKQTVPVAFNTLLNAGSIELSYMFNKGQQKFLDNLGMGISLRGLGSQAEIASINKLLEKASRSKLSKGVDIIEKINRGYLELFLANPDKYIARASWITYYEKGLKQQGIDPKGVDYNTHNEHLAQLRKGGEKQQELAEKYQEAADYAQRMVDKQQNISDTDLHGKLFSNKDNSSMIMTKVVMPFASFRMNQTMRFMTDWATIGNKTASIEDKRDAWKSIGGYSAEMAAFKVISTASSFYIGSFTNLLLGRDESEEDRQKRKDRIVKQQITGTVTDVLSPIPIMDYPTALAADGLLSLGQSLFGVDAKDKYHLQTSYKTDILKSLGSVGIVGARAKDLVDVIMLTTTGEYTDEFGRTKYISNKDREALKFIGTLSFLNQFGLMPSEVNSITRNAIAFAKRGSSSKEGGKEGVEDAKEEKNKIKNEAESSKDEIDNEILNKMLTKESNPLKRQAIQDKIDEVNEPLAKTKEEKDIHKEEVKKRKEEMKALLQGYDNRSDMQRYNHRLYEKTFGKNSDYYKTHKEEVEVEKELNRLKQKEEDKAMNYHKMGKMKKTNSDGSRRRRTEWSSSWSKTH